MLGTVGVLARMGLSVRDACNFHASFMAMGSADADPKCWLRSPMLPSADYPIGRCRPGINAIALLGEAFPPFSPQATQQGGNLVSD